MPYGEDHLPVGAMMAFGHHEKLPIIYILSHDNEDDDYEIVASMELDQAIKMRDALDQIIDTVSSRHMQA